MELSPTQHQVLDLISSGEATGYTELYGGKKFHSFEDHPRIPVPIPDSSQVSTAAGRYQMTAPTWDEEKARLGLKDFSPASQDQAAWDLAQRTYQEKTGRSLETDAKAGDVELGALASRWTSLGPKAAQQAVAKGPGATQMPSPQLAPLPSNALELAAQPGSFAPVSLVPVEHNPFQPTGSLVAVNHDPFQLPESSAP